MVDIEFPDGKRGCGRCCCCRRGCGCGRDTSSDVDVRCAALMTAPILHRCTRVIMGLGLGLGLSLRLRLRSNSLILCARPPLLRPQVQNGVSVSNSRLLRLPRLPRLLTVTLRYHTHGAHMAAVNLHEMRQLQQLPI